MSNIEIKFAEFIKKNLFVIAMMATTLISILIRFPLRDFLSGDLMGYLLPWYDEFKSGGGLPALDHQIGDYNVLYQFFIALFTYLPIKPIYTFKLFSVIFDYVAAGMIFYIIRCLTGQSENDKKSSWLAWAGYTAFLINPTVFLNSMCWAQCDSIYVSFCLGAILALLKERYTAAFIMLGIAFSFKLQAIFILPFIFFYWFVSRKFSIVKFIYIPVIFILSGIPSYLAGRNVIDVMKVYYKQMGHNLALGAGYPSFWYYFKLDYTDWIKEFYGFMKTPAMLITFTALMSIMIFLMVNDVKPEGEQMIRVCFILAYTCVYFLPCMHERYGFLAEALAIIIAVMSPKIAPLMVLMCSLSWFTYSDYLFEREANIWLLSLVNGVIYLIMVVWVLRSAYLERKKQEG